MTAPWNRYGPSAARAPGDPAPRIAGSIDIHSHVLAPAAAAFAAQHAAPRATGGEDGETAILSRQQNADRRSRMVEQEERLRELDAMGIERQVIMPAPGQCYHALPAEHAVTAARLVNEGVAAYAAKRPDRFIPFGTAPIQAGEAAAEELRHARDALGMRGVEVLTNVDGRELSDPAFAPFWAAAEALGLLVVIHPGGYTEPRRLQRFYFNNVIGNPLDTTVALHHLIFDGVLARHPALKLMAVHGGGYLPSYIGRIDHAWGARSDARGALPEAPSTYLKRVFLDTVVFTTHQLENLVRIFGAGQVMMGTDYPYDMAEYDPLGHLAGAALEADQVAAIAGGNARRVLGL
jgi:aminocarboxymuconate-semialdehyde decarboxylase